jgi:YegS/Rv2252/BmrU family lipid kinase
MKQAINNLPKILDIFTENGDINSVHLTRGQGDGAKLAADNGIPGSFDRIICIGGDGTFNEVVTGIQSAGHDIPIGYIPAGTANDLANSLNLSKNMTQAARDIIGGDMNYLDIGRFNDRYFTYIASFGAFTKASYSTPQISKNMLGHFAYILEGIKELPAIRPEYIKIESGGKIIEGEYIFGAVSNSKSVGGVVSLDPGMVDMSDGLFEVFLIKPLKNMQAVWDCAAAIINRNYHDSEHITFFTAGNARIHADPEMSWTLDGEYADANGQEKIEVENLCRAVRIIGK